MIKNRYFKRMWEEEYYIFDSETISEEEVDEKIQYDGYRAFEDSMQGDEVVRKLNDQCTLIELLRKDVLESFSELNKIQQTVFDFNKRDLSDIEKIFLKNFCKEAGIKVFCELIEDNFCNICGECHKLIDDYYSEVF